MSKHEIIFDAFSKNLQIVASLFNFQFDEKFRSDSYICPLSFKIFAREELGTDFHDILTIEHAPPLSLRGKGICLTRKNSNSSAGSNIDHKLIDLIKVKEFNAGIRPLITTGYVDGVKWIVKLDLKNQSGPAFQFLTKKWHHGNQKTVENINSNGKFNVTWKVPKTNRTTEIALLKTAYLIAFSHIGYSLLFGLTTIVNQSYELIRQQIADPDSFIIRRIPYLDKGMEDIPNGVHLIYHPADCRSLFVVFELKIGEKPWKYGVFLPGPDDYGLKAYEEILRRISKKGVLFNFSGKQLPLLNIQIQDDVRYFYEFWIEINGNTTSTREELRQ